MVPVMAMVHAEPATEPGKWGINLPLSAMSVGIACCVKAVENVWAAKEMGYVNCQDFRS